MSSTSDINISRNTWTNINLLTGIPTGSNMLIQNLNNSMIRIAESATMPNATNIGTILPPTLQGQIENILVTDNIWVYSIENVNLNVQAI